MRRRHRTIGLFGLLLTGCTFTSSSNDPGLPGVPGTSSDFARALFVSATITAVRETLQCWSAAVQDGEVAALDALYVPEAAVVQPGTMLLKGEEGVRAFVDAVVARSNDARASLLDIEVSDGIAYVYGAYDLQPARAGASPSHGYHVTVLRQSGREWRIRSQLFDPLSEEDPFVPGSPFDDPGMIDLGTTVSGTVPREAFLGVITMFAGFARSWQARDAGAVREAFEPGGLLRLPGLELAARGENVPAAVDSALAHWAGLATTELDFTASGRLAVLLGRYTLARGATNAVDGHYVLVAARSGNGWRIRSLVLG